jgi:FHA domain
VKSKILEVRFIMMKCPKCGFDNQEGALFCEQCREDLGTVPMAGVVEAMVVDEAVMAEAVVVAEPVVAAVVAEAAPVAAAPAPAAPAPTPAAPPPEAPAAGVPSVPAGAKPKLVVVRGQKINAEFPIYGDMNFIGRADEKPVDIDLEEQEPPDRIHSSRQHAVIHFDEAAGVLTIEDLNSANGTYVNRARIYPGQKKQLSVNDVVQIGNVHLKLQV